MPDAAHRDDMSPADAPALLGLRRFLLRTPLALPLVGVVGALLGGQAWVVVMIAAGFAMVLKLRRILVCMLLCAAIAACHEGILQREAERARDYAVANDTMEVQGTISEWLGHSCLLRAESPRTIFSLHGEEQLPFAEGDRVRLLVAPREAETPPVRGMFDRVAWMRSRGIALAADVIRAEKLENDPFCWAMLRSYATQIRRALAERLMPPGTEADARRQVLCALVLGARELAEPGTMLPFRRGGTLHAFAVSGMHVAILAGLLWPLLRVLRVRPSVARGVLLFLLAVYVLITGFSVPALRAYLMLAVLLMGIALRRRVGLANSWCFAALIVLLAEPWQLYSAGFILSFAIYAAICIGARLCLSAGSWFGPDAFIPPRIYTGWERLRMRADYSLRGVVIVSLVAYLVSLPLTAWLFHTLNPWSFLTNIAIAPLVPLVMLAGIVALAFAGLPVPGAAAQWLALRSAGWLLGVSTSLGYLPGAYLPATLPQPPQAAMVLGTGYGNSVCVLGNPGLVIDCGNELAAAFQVEPALFHAGFSPAALLLTQETKSRSGGADTLLATWPKMELIRAASLGRCPQTIEGTAGRFILYPPPAELPRGSAANAAPMVYWHMPDGRRLLYIGEASRATWEQLPPEARQADILILGANPKQPLHDPALLRESGATWVVLLPSAAEAECPLRAEDLAPGVRLLQLGERELLQLP